jgi:glycosyltransferase involved in cell wall biosynthesis
MDSYSTDQRIKKIYLEENHSVGAVRNLGLEKASGEFITFIDSDDYIHPHLYMHTMPYFSDRDVEAVYYDHYLTFPTYQRIHRMNSSAETGVYEKEQKSLFFTGASYCWNVIFRADILKRGWRIYDLALYEDIACHMIPVKARKIAYVKEALYFHRKYSTSLTQRTSSEAHYLIVDAVGLLIHDISQADHSRWYQAALIDLIKSFTFYYVYRLITLGKCPVNPQRLYEIQTQFLSLTTETPHFFAEPLVWLHLHYPKILLSLLKNPLTRKWVGRKTRQYHNKRK